MDLLSVTDPGWVFPAVLAFVGTGFTVLGAVWVHTTRKLNREEDAALAKLRAITARQFPNSPATARVAEAQGGTSSQPPSIQKGTDR